MQQEQAFALKERIVEAEGGILLEKKESEPRKREPSSKTKELWQGVRETLRRKKGPEKGMLELGGVVKEILAKLSEFDLDLEQLIPDSNVSQARLLPLPLEQLPKLILTQ
jgi:hypothetical protein